MPSDDEIVDAIERTGNYATPGFAKDFGQATGIHYRDVRSAVDPIVQADGGADLILYGSVFQNGGSQRRHGVLVITPKNVLTSWQQGVFGKKQLVEKIGRSSIATASIAPHMKGAQTRLLTVEGAGSRIQFLLPMGESRLEGALLESLKAQ